MDRTQSLAFFIVLLCACGPSVVEGPAHLTHFLRDPAPPLVPTCALSPGYEAATDVIERELGDDHLFGDIAPLVFLVSADAQYGDGWYRLTAAHDRNICGFIELRPTVADESGAAHSQILGSRTPELYTDPATHLVDRDYRSREWTGDLVPLANLTTTASVTGPPTEFRNVEVSLIAGETRFEFGVHDYEGSAVLDGTVAEHPLATATP